MCPAVRLAPFIDHTLLAPEAVEADIDRLCGEALRHGVAAVCVNPVWVGRCATRLAGSQVVVASVVAFPFGASDTAVKAAEAARAVQQGARELDMVVALGAVKDGDWRFVERDIAATVAAAGGAVVKAIIESALLSGPEIIQACEVARNAGAGYVKTSTGYHSGGGATATAVRLMRRTVGDDLGVKASGGIRDCAGAAAMFAAGATRIGSSRGAALAECVGTGPLPLSELPALPEEGAPMTAATAR
jgi:deoxyribose-phosphate aldolase